MKKSLICAAVVAACAPAAWATDGYFSHGYGMTAKGMGGAATAMAKDTFGGANNPASMVWVGNRVDVGADWFRPQRSASRYGSTGLGTGLDASTGSGSTDFLIPEFGYNRMLNDTMSLGVTVYGNGGMNTDYGSANIPAATACAGFNPNGPAGAPFNMLCGSGRLGIDLMQLVVAPTFSFKASADHSFGISPLLGYQRFKANGIDGFMGFTPNPAGWPGNNALTDRGYDSAHGWGVRVGWQGRVSPTVTLGVAYSTKIKMSNFDKYKDLFAGQGNFDMPENFNVGIAIKASKDVTWAIDYQRINYAGVASVANASTNTGNSVAGTGYTVGSLGCNTCRGFGWDNVGVIKIGVEYQYASDLILRAGYNHSDNPIQSRDVTFNILAPGVVQHHMTLGFTKTLSKDSEVTMSYMHAFKRSVEGSSLFNSWVPGAGNEKIQMYQDSLGIAYSVKY